MQQEKFEIATENLIYIGINDFDIDQEIYWTPKCILRLRGFIESNTAYLCEYWLDGDTGEPTIFGLTNAREIFFEISVNEIPSYINPTTQFKQNTHIILCSSLLKVHFIVSEKFKLHCRVKTREKQIPLEFQNRLNSIKAQNQ